MFRLFTYLISFFLPWQLRRIYLNWRFGFQISPGAKIGYSLVLPKMLKMENGARIGHMTVVKGLDLLSMDIYGKIGNLNWISGYPTHAGVHFSQIPDRIPALYISEHAAITNRHLIDCTDRVEIGCFSTVAGFRSQILTHSIDLATSRQSCKPVVIGSYCFVGTSSIILGGARLPDYSVLGAGGVLNSRFDEMYSLYGGVPAKKIKVIPNKTKYFSRHIGFVE